MTNNTMTIEKVLAFLDWLADTGSLTHPPCTLHDVRKYLIEQGLAASGDYVQNVPEQCDRIVWRGRYYHLREGAIEAVAGDADKALSAIIHEVGQAKMGLGHPHPSHARLKNAMQLARGLRTALSADTKQLENASTTNETTNEPVNGNLFAYMREQVNNEVSNVKPRTIK